MTLCLALVVLLGGSSFVAHAANRESGDITPVGDAEKVPQVASLETVIRKAGARLGCQGAFPQVSYNISEHQVSYSCAVSAGHASWVVIKEFNSAAEAEAAFYALQPQGGTFDYHGHTAASWTETRQPGQERIYAWFTERWLIKAAAFDDTQYIYAPSPSEYASAVHYVGQDQGLWN